MAISREIVEAAAPDAASLKAAQKIAGGRKLLELGRVGAVAWGDCAGSGSVPYRVACDLEGTPGWKCSCPSRKIPCKHVLGLALRLAEKPDDFGADGGVDKPSWVADWEKARARKAARESSPPKPVDEAARAKRILAREEKVRGGVAELELWLRDVMRGGLAGLPSRPYEFWDKAAARATDAQMSGLARRLRDMASVPHSGPGWQEEMLHRLGGLHLIAEGYKRLDSLSAARQADIRALIGWNVDQAELLESGAPVRDSWLALSFHEEEADDGLRTGRTWLWGEEINRPALVLQFGFGGALVSPAAPPGTSFEGELVFFPGTLAQRALVKQKFGAAGSPRFAPPGLGTAQVLAAWARGLAAFPWLDSVPCVLHSVLPTRIGSVLWAMDAAGALPIDTRRIDEWALLAASGGRATSLFGLWNGRAFEPLCSIMKSDAGAQISALHAAARTQRTPSEEIPFDKRTRTLESLHKIALLGTERAGEMLEVEPDAPDALRAALSSDREGALPFPGGCGLAAAARGRAGCGSERHHSTGKYLRGRIAVVCAPCGQRARSRPGAKRRQRAAARVARTGGPQASTCAAGRAARAAAHGGSRHGRAPVHPARSRRARALAGGAESRVELGREISQHA
jgi:hypothetical protein